MATLSKMAGYHIQTVGELWQTAICGWVFLETSQQYHLFTFKISYHSVEVSTGVLSCFPNTPLLAANGNIYWCTKNKPLYHINMTWRKVFLFSLLLKKVIEGGMGDLVYSLNKVGPRCLFCYLKVYPSGFHEILAIADYGKNIMKIRQWR